MNVALLRSGVIKEPLVWERVSGKAYYQTLEESKGGSLPSFVAFMKATLAAVSAGGLEEIPKLAAELQEFSRRDFKAASVSNPQEVILLDLTLPGGWLLLPYVELRPDVVAISSSSEDGDTVAIRSAPGRNIPWERIQYLSSWMEDFDFAVQGIASEIISPERKVRLITWRSAEGFSKISLPGLTVQAGTAVETLLRILFVDDQARQDFEGLFKRAQDNWEALAEYL